ncbi:MAG: S49 family peptidase [Gammaproteobacteria bacterium]|nr:MAG: S49 family peptidase [Gammaproteobacteria bacterium]
MEPKINLDKISNDDRSSSGWEREAIVNLAQSGLKEQRRARKWGIFFKLLGFAYVSIFLVTLMAPYFSNFSAKTQHTALVELAGVIADGEEASADNIVSGLRAAFENNNSAAVILRINSPGGSPVQASYINREITRLREMHPEKPIYAVVTDICASGGVFAAVATDKIYADKASIVGSIGVRMDGFGFVDAMEKLGVERRLMTAGEHKGLLDPFQPENEFEKQHIQSLLDEIHQQFIDVVVEGRGDKLAKDKNMFSGLFWTGEQALELGLVDGFGSASYVAREVVGVEDIQDYTFREDIFQRFAKRLGTAMVEPVIKALTYPVLH